MTFKILSLDGGGIRGVLSAQLLALFEAVLQEQTGQRLYDYFDLVVGTSTGAILASGVAMGRSADTLVQLYLDQGRRIFPYWGTFSYLAPQRLGLIVQHGFSAPKYSHRGLQKVLREQFGQRCLGELSEEAPKLLIPTYDTVARRPILFNSWEQRLYGEARLWEVVLASASAPTFFPSYSIQVGGFSYSLVDGGVGANNPATCAIAAALDLGYALRDIRLLSIGTGSGTRGYAHKVTQHWGVSQWAKHIPDILMDAPMDILEQIAQQTVTLGSRYPNHYLRLQPELSNSALDTLLDASLRDALKPHLKGKRPVICEDIDNASTANMQTLMALAKGYFRNHALIYHLGPREPKQMTLKEAIQVWISSSYFPERDSVALAAWH